MRQIVAIDIGAFFTKLTIAEPRGKILAISDFKSFSTPYHKEDTFNEEEFFSRLFSIVPQAKLKASQLAIGLAASTTNFSFFEVPSMGHADLQRAIVSEAQRTIRPTPTDNDILRHVIIKDAKSKENHATYVLAGAGMESEIMRYYSLFEKREIAPSFIGSSASSLMAYSLGYYPDLPENWCFVDIGHTNTTIVIFSRSIPTLVRTIIFASRDFVRAISAEQKIDMEAAQRVFLNQGAPEIVNNNWEYLISEIRRSFAYYKEVSAAKPIEGVYFSGGIFAIGSYIDILKRNIGGKVELFDISSVKNISIDQVDPKERALANFFFANSLGLALSLGERKRSLNFLPSAALKEKQTQQIQQTVQVASKFAALALIVIFGLLLFQIFVYKAKLGNELRDFSETEYSQVIAARQQISGFEAEINAQESFINAQQQISQKHRQVFSLIAKYIPTNAYLFSTTSGEAAGAASGGPRRGMPAAGSGPDAGETIKYGGWIQATYEDSVDQLRLFVKKLSKTGAFQKVALNRPTLDQEPFQPYATDFTLNVKREFELELTLK